MLLCQYCTEPLQQVDTTVISCTCEDSVNKEIANKERRRIWLKEREIVIDKSKRRRVR